MNDQRFLWGAASAAFQVEGATCRDGRGPSIWDHYLEHDQIAGLGVSGRVAINFYDRAQYLDDIALMAELGLTSYRFSIAWPRILPDGLGPVNPAGIAHYRRFIADLKAAHITPMITLYHWDMPAALAKAGGWEHPDAPTWFQRYAAVIFEHFAEDVELFCLVNEPTMEQCLRRLVEEHRRTGEGQFHLVPPPFDLGRTLEALNNVLLACAAAKRVFHERGGKGALGLAVPFFPVLTDEKADEGDRQSARQADGLLNRWYLDALYHGRYPSDILALDHGLDAGQLTDDAARIGEVGMDWLGVNYYAPAYIRRPKGAAPGYAAEMFLPQGECLSHNGPVRPDMLKQFLARLRSEYANPPTYITENGAGFPEEDVLVAGKVKDQKRCDYIERHVRVIHDARAEGSDLRGYYVWTSHDNLEWTAGFERRFGLIHVDYTTQKRTPKQSARTYARLIADGGL